MGKRRRSSISTIKVAVACAAVTTVLARAASGLVFASGGRRFAEQIHYVALAVMLIAYLFLITTLMAAKKSQPVSLSVVEVDNSLVISPCDIEQCAILDQTSIDRASKNPHEVGLRKRRLAIRFLIARDVSIPDSFLIALTLFPNLTLLDIQNARVSQEFWALLEELPSLKNVLATNAISDELLRKVSLSLPEVKFWVGKHRNLVIASKASLNPKGARDAS